MILPDMGSNPSPTVFLPCPAARLELYTITWMDENSRSLTQISVKRDLAQAVADELVHFEFLRATPIEIQHKELPP